MRRSWLLVALALGCGSSGSGTGTQPAPGPAPPARAGWDDTSSGSEGQRERGLQVVDEQPAAEPAPEPLPMTRELEFAMDRYARRLAVTVGVNAYDGPIPSLRSAVSDARHVADQLDAMGFEIVETIEDEEATREGVLSTLRGTLGEEVGPNDLVVVFFAGHGVTEGDMGYVLPSDATREVKATGISVQELKEVALRWENRHSMFVVDACFSGTMFRRPFESADTSPLAYWQAASEQRLVEILTAGDEGEEVVERGGWGLFTRALVDGLRGAADGDEDGIVSGRELARHIRRVVVAETDGAQHPQWGAVEGNGTVLFWDARRVVERQERLTRELPVPAEAGEALAEAHRLLDRGEHREAQNVLRRAILQHAHPALNLALAEAYLLQDPDANAAQAERELENADEAELDERARRALIELRARLERARRGRL